jgi:serine/threonine protein kinase
MFNKIKAGDFRFDNENWANVSQDAKDLITSLLKVNPDERLSASQALKSKWIDQAEDQVLSERELSRAVIQIKARRPRLRELAKVFMGLRVKKVANEYTNPVVTEEDSDSQLV